MGIAGYIVWEQRGKGGEHGFGFFDLLEIQGGKLINVIYHFFGEVNIRIGVLR